MPRTVKAEVAGPGSIQSSPASVSTAGFFATLNNFPEVGILGVHQIGEARREATARS
jgi:hypothetical protein